jgi:hypothetical protein
MVNLIEKQTTSTNRYINSSSFHVLSQKSAAFHSMANRLINVPMTEKDYKTEKNNIIQIKRVQRDVYQEYNREA